MAKANHLKARRPGRCVPNATLIGFSENAGNVPNVPFIMARPGEQAAKKGGKERIARLSGEETLPSRGGFA
jgi:isopropylmalate/homocitrate/citramalate synthase